MNRAAALRPDLQSLRRLGYVIAWIEGDVAAMARELEAAQQLPKATAVADLAPRTMAFGGMRAAHDAFVARSQLQRRPSSSNLRHSGRRWTAKRTR